MALVHGIETVLLDREEVHVALGRQVLDRPLVNFGEASELSVVRRHYRHGRVGHLLELANVDVVLFLPSLCRAYCLDLFAVYKRKTRELRSIECV